MYYSNVPGSKIVKIVAILNIFAVLASLLPITTFAQVASGDTSEESQAKTEQSQVVDICPNIPNSQLELPDGMAINTVSGDCEQIPEDPICTDDSAKNFNEVGQCEYEEVQTPVEECEIEGHKYDEKGNPLSGWTIGLMKTITHNDGADVYDLATDITNEDGYFCLEWDGETRALREDTESSYVGGPYTFNYKVFEELQTGWKNVSIEKGPDYLDLAVPAEDEISTEGKYVSVNIGEEGGYIYADAAYHVDFYNTEIDPCDESRDDMIKATNINQDPCDNSDDDNTISGYKFNDLNGDGIWDKELERGIEGWEINLDQSDSETRHTTTDETGYYEFTVDAGSYQVTETNQKGWNQTALVGENADGDTCYIDTNLIMSKSAVVQNELPADNTCTFGNQQIPDETPVCKVGNNLLVNGSFEDPVVEGDWSIFETVAGWTIAMSNGLELWANGFYGGASKGNQNAELDGNAPTKITQSITTVPGATYELRFDFSARPDADSTADNSVDGLVNGVAIMNATADGSDITTNTWSQYSQNFVAASTTTEVGFEDKGVANTLGSLIDNAVVCLVRTPNDGGDDNTPKRNGGGSGSRVKRAPTGEVLGAQASTPTGEVLGEATSTLPVGAPNTGAGGTSPVSVQLPTVVAILPKTQKIK